MYVCKKCNSVANRKPHLNSIENVDVYGYGRNRHNSTADEIHNLVNKLVELGVKHENKVYSRWNSNESTEYKLIRFEICNSCEHDIATNQTRFPGLGDTVIDPEFYTKKFKLSRKPLYLSEIVDVKNLKIFGHGILNGKTGSYNKIIDIDVLKNICDMIPDLNFLEFNLLKNEISRSNSSYYYQNYIRFKDSEGFWYPINTDDFFDYVRYYKKGLTINSEINFKSSSGLWTANFIKSENIEFTNDYVMNLLNNNNIINDNDIQYNEQDDDRILEDNIDNLLD